ncbi:MAG: citrate synthase, partial [Ruminococcaceae bacterium]|nr:citrate synthase [Oscillospiraceae bacterium]
MRDSYSEITSYIKELSDLSTVNNHIEPQMYAEHQVNRGLRDLNGNGVVTGLTEVSRIKAKTTDEN